MSLCSCADDCLQRKDCCADYKTVCQGFVSVFIKCVIITAIVEISFRFDLPPVILFSMDGFRAEYLQTWSTLVPNINKLKTCGIHSKYMRAMYPTKTFPNHYTIVTCRKPDQHFKPYLTPDLPKRLHYANNVRIDKAHLMVDRQWLAMRSKSSSSCGGGTHGYNNEFKSMEGNTSPLPPTVSDCLRADVRVAPLESQKCSFYLADKNITHGFLYPPEMWHYFHEFLLIKYAVERNGINVVSGPIFDYNYDGHFDAPDEITQHVANTDVPIPTHYFVVLTSCKDKAYTPDSCPGWLDVLPFIIPHRPTNMESCPENRTEDLWVEDRFKAHIARVRDVELLTGLDFYQEKAQPVSEILQLKTYLPTFETVI
ncbi:hypothetical protein NN561_017821 [Cricetulus griseus]